ncbi:MAG: hypothetical protein M0R76_09810 [Proteobacteria bacterium]|nr:hypothetical protein [Pseudomonadota bacterium]
MVGRIPVLGIVLLIIGLFSAVVTVKMVFFDMPTAKNLMQEAIYIGSDKLLPENEGKIVIVNGTLKLVKPAYDKELGITINSIRAFRNEYILNLKLEYKNKSHIRKEEEDWKRTATSKEFIGKAMIGEFHISQELATAFNTGKTYVDYDPLELEKANLHRIEDYRWSQKYFLENASEKPVDRIRYHYSCVDMGQYEHMTIIGRQKGSSLELVQGLKAHSVIEETLDFDGVLKHAKAESWLFGILAVLATILFIALGIWRIRVR